MPRGPSGCSKRGLGERGARRCGWGLLSPAPQAPVMILGCSNHKSAGGFTAWPGIPKGLTGLQTQSLGGPWDKGWGDTESCNHNGGGGLDSREMVGDKAEGQQSTRGAAGTSQGPSLCHLQGCCGW